MFRLTNILLRSDRFTKQSFAMEIKIRYNKLKKKNCDKVIFTSMGKKSIMQSLELASVASQKDTHYWLTYCITYYFTLNLIYYAMNAV